MKTKTCCFAAAAVLAVVCAERSTAQTANEVTKLTASDGGPGDRFGKSVSVSEDVVVIGDLVLEIAVKPVECNEPSDVGVRRLLGLVRACGVTAARESEKRQCQKCQYENSHHTPPRAKSIFKSKQDFINLLSDWRASPSKCYM